MLNAPQEKLHGEQMMDRDEKLADPASEDLQRPTVCLTEDEEEHEEKEEDEKEEREKGGGDGKLSRNERGRRDSRGTPIFPRAGF